MEQAIKKAMEGGWGTSNTYLNLKSEMSTVRLPTAREMDAYQEIATKYIHTIALLDPLFWQALGKAEGWEGEMYIEGKGVRNVKDWLHNWHLFIDHLANSGILDDFFNKLLTK